MGGGYAGEYNSLALGSDGYARISYYVTDSDSIYALKFAQCTNADCSTKNTTTIDNTNIDGWYTSIAIGSDGYARIGYYEQWPNYDLKFVQCTNADCSTNNIATIDSTGNTGLYTSTAIRPSDDYVYISYFDDTNNDLKFAYQKPEYNTSGTYTSGAIDVGFGVPSWGNLSWTHSGGETITMKARSDVDGNFADATAWGSCSSITSGNALSTGGCATNGHQYIQYQASLSTADTATTPSLDDITIGYNAYATSATLMSTPYDTGDATNVLTQISWTESLASGTDVKFQLRTSPDNSTWTNWLGPTGTGDYYTDYTGGETINSNHRDGTDEQWTQYKLFLTSDGSDTATFSDITLEYVINASPVISNVTASQDSAGALNVTYDVTDAEEANVTMGLFLRFGTMLNEELTNSDTTAITLSDASLFPTSGTILIDSEEISYTGKSSNDLTGLTRGANTTNAVAHTSSMAVYVKASTTSGDTGTIATGSGKSAAWTVATDLDVIYSSGAYLKVLANDGNAANQVGTSESSSFVFDVKDPVVGANPILVQATTSPALLTLSATDDTALQMQAGLASDLSGASYVSYGATTTLSLATDPDVVYARFKDAKGNVTSIQNVTTPNTPASLMVQDTTNTLTDPDEERLFLVWGVVTAPTPGFASYQVWRSTDGSDYGTVPVTTITDRTINYYTDNSVASTSTYYYKVVTADSNTNSSSYSSAVSGTPDGVQGSGEGGGGGDTTAPVVSNITTSNVTSNSATITWTTDELSDSTVGFSTTTDVFTTEQGVASMVTSHSVTLTSLIPGSTYYYQVKSYDPSSNVVTDDNSNDSFATLSDSAGPVISAVTASTTSGLAAAGITWTTDEAATSQVEFGQTTSYGTLTIKDETLETAHTVNLTSANGLATYTAYHYRVRSVDAANNETISPDHIFTTGDTTAPVISSVATSSVTASGATITWTTDESSDSVIGYSATAGNFSTQAGSPTLTTSHSVALSNLSASTTYYFQARSTDSSGNLGYDPTSGNGYSVTTLADSTVPVISALSASSSVASSADITWTTDEAADSAVAYGTTTAYSATSTNASLTTSHSISLSSLNGGVTYHYRVVSADTDGNTTYSPDYTFVAGDATPPVISSIDVPSRGTTEATIVWLTDEDADSQVHYGTTSGSLDQSTALDTTLTLVHAVSLSGLTENTTYYYTVTSKDEQSNSATSAEQSFSTISQTIQQITQITQCGGGGGGSFQDTIPPRVHTIAVTGITDRSALLTWRTSEDANTIVAYGTDTSYTNEIGWDVCTLNTYTTQHEAILTGLNGGTTYHALPQSQDRSGNLGIGTDTVFTTKGYAFQDTNSTADTSDFVALLTPEQRTEGEEKLAESQSLLAKAKTAFTEFVDLFGKQNAQEDIAHTLASFEEEVRPLVEEPHVLGEVPRVTVAGTTATIEWRTDKPSATLLSLAKDTQYDAESDNPFTLTLGTTETLTTDHSLTLHDLSPAVTHTPKG